MDDNFGGAYMDECDDWRNRYKEARQDRIRDSMLLKLTDLIHGEVCGCDDKRCEWPTEIHDWLANGDAQELTEQDVPDLVHEWLEYQGRA